VTSPRLGRRLLLAGALGAAALAVMGGRAALAAAPARAGSVTFLAGEATRTAAGKAEKLAVGSAIYEGDALATGKRTRLEVTLADGSVIRLGPVATAQLTTATFGRTAEDRKVTARLGVGNAWAKVAKTVGGESRFEVQTENAVAGVRGTTFRVDAAKDRSVVVRVYAGTVAVAGGGLPRPAHGGPRPERKQIDGPQEVTREQWEKIVTTMMEVRVSAEGVPAEPVAFAADPKDDWERWNQARDAAR
jgi:hypothetical protein